MSIKIYFLNCNKEKRDKIEINEESSLFFNKNLLIIS